MTNMEDALAARAAERERAAKAEEARKAANAARTFNVLSPAECEVNDPRPYVIKGLVARADHVQIIGQPGSGKSALAPLAGYCIAKGLPFFGRRVRQGPVLYFAAEDGHGMKLRVRALRQRFGDAPSFFLIPDGLDLLDSSSGDLARMCGLIRLHLPVAIFIDTVARSFPGLRENDTDSMGMVVRVARELAAEQCQPAVVTLHHPAKAEGTTPRGSGVLNGDLDAVLLIDGAGAALRTVSMGKNRNGPSDASFAFNIETEDFGPDDDGDLITAAVAAPVEVIGNPAKAAKETSLKDAPALMLREIRNLITSYGEPIAPTPGHPIVLSITRHLLRLRLVDKGWFADGLLSTDAQGKMTLTRAAYGPENVALKALERRGIISKTQTHVWLL